jgi:biuret amidohydrolase
LALVVYDMQVGILRQIADRERVLAQVVRMLEAARAARVRTFFMRHVTLPTELMGASQMRMWMAWQRAEHPADIVSPFPPDAPQTQLVPELSPGPRETVFDKVTMSAFEGTPLNIALRDCGIVSVAIVGVALEVGIEPTARHAADLGYVPIVVTDACGAGDPNRRRACARCPRVRWRRPVDRRDDVWPGTRQPIAHAPAGSARSARR